MKVHLIARDAADWDWLQVAADELAAASVSSGRRADFLLFSDVSESYVYCVELSRSVARRLGGPGPWDEGRRSLALRVRDAVLASLSESGVSAGEVVH